jgi:hypothetical protein
VLRACRTPRHGQVCGQSFGLTFSSREQQADYGSMLLIGLAVARDKQAKNNMFSADPQKSSFGSLPDSDLSPTSTCVAVTRVVIATFCFPPFHGLAFHCFPFLGLAFQCFQLRCLKDCEHAKKLPFMLNPLSTEGCWVAVQRASYMDGAPHLAAAGQPDWHESKKLNWPVLLP